MKTFFKVVLFVFVAAFYSCGKDEVSSASSSITSAGVISGTISNYGVSPVDSIHFNGSNAIVSTDGKFSKTLSIPRSTDLYEIGLTDGLKISDVKALISELEIVPYYNSNSGGGELLKTNITENMTSPEGASLSMFLYCDRDITITGTGSEKGEIMEFTGMMTFDLKLKKGWNEVVFKIEKFSLTTGEATMKVSNTIPSDSKWLYIGEDTAGTASKIKMMKSLLKK
jgi:hypothetical protein